jgi:phosphate:Na+ symporter
MDILALLIGGLAIFIYAISQLSETLKEIFTERAKQVIKKYTSHILSAILIGTLITIILDSSSAVIILTIVFINAKALTFRQAIGIIMGANIGTTFSSQIIAMDVGKYSIIPLFIGMAIMLFARGKTWKRAGQILLYFGMLFFGLFIMETSVIPLKDSDVFEEMIARLENPVQGALIGGLVTLIIQSSSATVGIAIVLGKQQLISIAGGIAVMLGAELGTCSDTLIATINGRRQALKAGLFHLLFNLSTIIIGLLIFHPFVSFVEWISGSQGIDNHIANAHMLFNIGGVVLFLPVVGLFEKMLNSLLPDKKKAAVLK